MYYIDGYNVIHTSSRLKSRINRDLESARDGLIDKVASFCTVTGQEVTIVFDGTGKHKADRVEHHRGVDHMHVLYAPGNLTADSVIERMIYKARNKLSMVVVSNDNGLRNLCRGMGAMTMEADSFLKIARESRSDISTTVNRTRKETPSFLEDSLDDGALEKLQALRDKLK